MIEPVKTDPFQPHSVHVFVRLLEHCDLHTVLYHSLIPDRAEINIDIILIGLGRYKFVQSLILICHDKCRIQQFAYTAFK